MRIYKTVNKKEKNCIIFELISLAQTLDIFMPTLGSCKQSTHLFSKGKPVFGCHAPGVGKLRPSRAFCATHRAAICTTPSPWGLWWDYGRNPGSNKAFYAALRRKCLPTPVIHRPVTSLGHQGSESDILPPTPQPWLQSPLMRAVKTRGFWSMHSQSFE